MNQRLRQSGRFAPTNKCWKFHCCARPVRWEFNSPTNRHVRCQANVWPPVFGDVEEALSQLRSAGYKLGVLTNCDEDLFAQTQRSFKHPFDLVVTAERVKDYKPS